MVEFSNPKTVQHLVGQSSIAGTMDIYTHFSKEDEDASDGEWVIRHLRSGGKILKEFGPAGSIVTKSGFCSAIGYKLQALTTTVATRADPLLDTG